jgi:hypothetical protein
MTLRAIRSGPRRLLVGARSLPLLRFVAGLMKGYFPDDDEHEHYVGAIHNAADFFEGGTTA